MTIRIEDKKSLVHLSLENVPDLCSPLSLILAVSVLTEDIY